MDKVRIIKLLLFLVLLFVTVSNSFALELTRDNPKTLISKNSKDMSVVGIKLGMTHKEAWRILKQQKHLMAKTDSANPSRIYVYRKYPDGSKGKSVFYLIWGRGETKLDKIAIFNEFKRDLSPAFQFLLSMKALDNSSDVKKKIIGMHSRKVVVSNIPLIQSKTVAHVYDKIGLTVNHHQDAPRERANFTLVSAKYLKSLKSK